jgi:hypothetical protein
MATTTEKIAAAAQIIKDGALEMLASKSGFSVDEVANLILSGHEGAARQFRQLVEAGIEQAMKMHSAGEIALVG